MINILATLKLISFCSRIQQIFSAQQYNSILRQIEDSYCFWSTGKTQDCRMQFPNGIPKRLIIFSREGLYACALVWGVVSCNCSCWEFSPSKIIKSSALSPSEVKKLLTAWSFLIHCPSVSSAWTWCVTYWSISRVSCSQRDYPLSLILVRSETARCEIKVRNNLT